MKKIIFILSVLNIFLCQADEIKDPSDFSGFILSLNGDFDRCKFEYERNVTKINKNLSFSNLDFGFVNRFRFNDNYFGIGGGTQLFNMTKKYEDFSVKKYPNLVMYLSYGKTMFGDSLLTELLTGVCNGGFKYTSDIESIRRCMTRIFVGLKCSKMISKSFSINGYVHYVPSKISYCGAKIRNNFVVGIGIGYRILNSH